jgi:large subunit ribosomal protein L9
MLLGKWRGILGKIKHRAQGGPPATSRFPAAKKNFADAALTREGGAIKHLIPHLPDQPHFSMSTTEIILTEKIDNLGVEADVVKVKRGYARNFLVPQGKALEVTPATLKRLNQLKAKRAEREAKELNESEDLARKINKLKITVELETGETGKAFGSVTAADLAERLKKELGGSIEIDRHRIHLEKPIKDTGEHEVTIKLHADVVAKLTVNVKAKGGEAAAGEAEEKAEERGFKARPKAKHSK